jgi:hypothetical protein
VPLPAGLFSIQSETRIYDRESRQVVSQYIVRPPLSVEKIYWDAEQGSGLPAEYGKLTETLALRRFPQ